MLNRVPAQLFVAAILLGAVGSLAGAAESEKQPDKAGAVKDQAVSVKQPTPKKIAWFDSLAKAQEAAKKQNKILFVDFHATWCPPCKMLDAQTFQNPAFQKAAASLVCAKIDIDKDKLSAVKYQVAAVPTLVFFSPSGEKIARFDGADAFLPAPRAVQTIENVVSDERDFADLEKKVQAQPGNPETTLRLARIHVRRESIERAEKLLADVERVDAGKNAKADNKAIATRKEMIKRAYEKLTMARVSRINGLLGTNKTTEAVQEMKALLATNYAPAEIKEQASKILKEFDKPDAQGK